MYQNDLFQYFNELVTCRLIGYPIWTCNFGQLQEIIHIPWDYGWKENQSSSEMTMEKTMVNNLIKNMFEQYLSCETWYTFHQLISMPSSQTKTKCNTCTTHLINATSR